MPDSDFQSHRFLDKYSRFFSSKIPTNMPTPFRPTQSCARRTNRGHPFYFLRRFLFRSRQHGEWPLYFFVRCTRPREAVPSGLRSKAERNPMLPFAFERRLLTFSAKTPAFDWLFQFPPATGRRIRPFPKVAFPSCVLLFLLRGFYPAAEHPADFFEIAR